MNVLQRHHVDDRLRPRVLEPGDQRPERVRALGVGCICHRRGEGGPGRRTPRRPATARQRCAGFSERSSSGGSAVRRPARAEQIEDRPLPCRRPPRHSIPFCSSTSAVAQIGRQRRHGLRRQDVTAVPELQVRPATSIVAAENTDRDDDEGRRKTMSRGRPARRSAGTRAEHHRGAEAPSGRRQAGTRGRRGRRAAPPAAAAREQGQAIARAPAPGNAPGLGHRARPRWRAGGGGRRREQLAHHQGAATHEPGPGAAAQRPSRSRAFSRLERGHRAAPGQQPAPGAASAGSRQVPSTKPAMAPNSQRQRVQLQADAVRADGAEPPHPQAQHDEQPRAPIAPATPADKPSHRRPAPSRQEQPRTADEQQAHRFEQQNLAQTLFEARRGRTGR